MELLFDDRLAPMTSTMLFFELDIVELVVRFYRFKRKITRDHRRLGFSLATKTVSGNLETVLRSLLPLISVDIRKFLFIPTASPWVAFVSNGWNGTDPTSSTYYAKLFQCRVLRVTAVPHTIRGKWPDVRGRFGAVMFEVNVPAEDPQKGLRRAIVAMNEDRWIFENIGEPFPFEDTERYKAKRVRDRFTF